MSRTVPIAPWQVRWIDLGRATGSEQGGVRPAVVVSSEVHCRFPIELSDAEAGQVHRRIHRMLA